MPTFSAEELQSVASRILQAAGVAAAEAGVVAEELKKANLTGHDSHGVIRLMQYVDYIEQGYIRPGADFEVFTERPGFAIVDGHFHFGQVTATKALELGMAKARQNGTATVAIRNCNHVGRLGSYSQQAAENGLASLMVANAPGPGGVAPFGGVERRLGTNPVTMAAPWGQQAIVLDMTTSATAEGKLRVAHQKGEMVPEGWIIDGEGNPTTDPADFYGEPPGALLPLGGALGFKGFGLSVMVDIFGGILTGSGICREDLPRGANGVWMSLVAIDQFIDRGEYDRWMDRYVASLKDSRKAAGVEEILLPGEIELRRQAQRQNEGIPVAEETWRQIGNLAARLGVSVS